MKNEDSLKNFIAIRNQPEKATSFHHRKHNMLHAAVPAEPQGPANRSGQKFRAVNRRNLGKAGGHGQRRVAGDAQKVTKARCRGKTRGGVGGEEEAAEDER